jgi:crotonobetaine/carnitine-CoA ligase
VVATLPWSAVAGHEPVIAEYATPSDTAEVLFTSGTTGRSKAVMLSHNQICRGAGWVAWSLGLGPDDVLHAWPPIFHVAAQIDGILPMVVGGGAAALYPRFSRSSFWAQVEESRATVFIGFANVLEWLSQLDPRPDDAESTLRAGIVGAVPAALARTFSERFGVRLHDSYGMTEVEPIAIPPPDRHVPPGAWGPPRPDLEVVVLDEDDVVLPVGATGQIAVRPRVPDIVTRGYEDDADATLAVMRNFWFHTGDLGRFDEDGNLWFVDRMRHAIRRRGENISSWEIEQVLLTHPAIDECCAVGIPDGLGEDDVLVAIVEAAGTEVELASLREWCAARMARFMVPRFAVIVDELPRTPVAKVIKQEIPDLQGRVDLCAVATVAPSGRSD